MLDGWLERLEARSAAHVIALGLERVRTVGQRLMPKAFPHPVITVGGTNGKGSTCAYLERMLLCGGYRVGCYTSPHLLRFNERVRLSGEPAADEWWVEALEAVEAARGELALTYFEHTTLAALWGMAREPLDAVVLEVGLGGRLDAVNVLDAEVAIITAVDLDHQQYLGADRDAIGREKAGIARSDYPVIVADPNPPVGLQQAIAEIGAKAWYLGRDFGFEREAVQWRWWAGPMGTKAGLPPPALRGQGQWHNASAAILALELLRPRLPLPQQAIREGLLTVELPGRFQVLPGRPQIVLDVAHNPHAARALSTNLLDLGFAPRSVAIFGCLADKDARGIVAPLVKRFDAWYVVPTPGARGQAAETLSPIVAAAGAKQVHTAPSVAAALEAVLRTASGDDRIVVFGSFYTVADALRWQRSHRP